MTATLNPPVTPEQVEAHLSDVIIKQLTFKIGVSTNIAVCIAEHLLKDKICWADEIPFPVINAEDRNCIGGAFKRLARIQIIERMEGHYRRSKKKERRGGIIFKYRIGNESLAKTFLKRNGVSVFKRSADELNLV